MTIKKKKKIKKFFKLEQCTTWSVLTNVNLETLKGRVPVLATVPPVNVYLMHTFELTVTFQNPKVPAMRFYGESLFDCLFVCSSVLLKTQKAG